MHKNFLAFWSQKANVNTINHCFDSLSACFSICAFDYVLAQIPHPLLAHLKGTSNNEYWQKKKSQSLQSLFQLLSTPTLTTTWSRTEFQRKVMLLHISTSLASSSFFLWRQRWHQQFCINLHPIKISNVFIKSFFGRHSTLDSRQSLFDSAV